MFRRQLLATVGLGAAGSAVARTASAGLEYTEEDVRIESFDGTELAATLYEPTAPGKYPVVLGTHGWGGSRRSSIGHSYAPRGYVVLSYDSRGFGESEGEVGVNGPNEVRDVSALIDWLEEHDSVRVEGWNGASVGMVGGSYAGGIQLNAAAVDDRIDAIVPRIAWHDLNYSLRPNGVVKLIWTAGLFAVGELGARQRVVDEGSALEERVTDAATGVEPTVHRAFVEGIALNDYSDDAESFFAERSPKAKLDDIDVPALFVQGWTDHLFVPNEAIWNFEAFRERGREAKLVLYNGGHSQIPIDDDPEQTASVRDEATRAWLADHLGSRDGLGVADVFDGHDVLVYEPQPGRIRGADGIPPSGSETVELELADGAESDSGGSIVGNTVVPLANSYVISETIDGPTSVAFEFDVGETFGIERRQQVDLLTVPELELSLRPLGPEATLFVRVVHVTDDEEIHVNDAVTPIRVEGAFGEAQTTTVELIAFQRYLSPGDHLRLVVDATDAGFNASRMSGGAVVDHESTLRLPGVSILDDPVA